MSSPHHLFKEPANPPITQKIGICKALEDLLAGDERALNGFHLKTVHKGPNFDPIKSFERLEKTQNTQAQEKGREIAIQKERRGRKERLKWRLKEENLKGKSLLKTRTRSYICPSNNLWPQHTSTMTTFPNSSWCSTYYIV